MVLMASGTLGVANDYQKLSEREGRGESVRVTVENDPGLLILAFWGSCLEGLYSDWTSR